MTLSVVMFSKTLGICPDNGVTQDDCGPQHCVLGQW